MKPLRYEYKYIFPAGQIDRLRSLILPFMELDRHAAESGGEYTVRSIYFDTPDLECYYQKLAGVKRRNKVRLRGYNSREDGNLVFFEIKKKVDEPLFKNRAALTFEEAKEVLAGRPPEDFFANAPENAPFLNDARRFLYHVHARQMTPVVTVIYQREPYQAILKDRRNDLRITFDKNLRAVPHPRLENLFDESVSYPAIEGSFIMEVKFNRFLPAWTRAIINSAGLHRSAASKYAFCIEACPEIRQWKQFSRQVIFGQGGGNAGKRFDAFL